MHPRGNSTSEGTGIGSAKRRPRRTRTSFPIPRFRSQISRSSGVTLVQPHRITILAHYAGFLMLADYNSTFTMSTRVSDSELL